MPHARFLLLFLAAFLSHALRADNNGITWNSTGLPSSGTAGATITFTASVTNSGTNNWGGGYYLVLSNATGNLNIPVLRGNAGKTADVTFTLTLPSLAGTYTYYFRAEQQDVETFGPVVQATEVTVPAGPPQNIAISHPSTSGFTVNWSPAAGATSYFVDIATTWDFEPDTFVVRAYDTWGATTYQAAGLTPAVNYFVRVATESDSGTSPPSSPGVRIETYAANDIWISGGYFNFRLGAGGSIQDAISTETGLPVSEQHGVNDTDGPWAWTLRDNCSTFNSPTVDSSGDDPVYNENQSGGFYNIELGQQQRIAPTVSVSSSNDSYRIYSMPQDQWYSDYQSHASAICPSYTSYRLLSDGAIQVRKIVLLGPVAVGQPPHQSVHTTYLSPGIYFESAWNAFDSTTNPTAAFNSYAGDGNPGTGDAVEFKGDGRISGTWHTVDSPGTSYQATPVQNTCGYALAFQTGNGAAANFPAIAIVFGTAPMTVIDSEATQSTHVLNFDDWGAGFALLPALQLEPEVEAGAVIDYQYYMLNAYPSSAFQSQLGTYVDGTSVTGAPLPHAILYGPGYFQSPPSDADPTLLSVVAQLQNMLSTGATGTRTIHLGSLQ